MHPLRLHPFPAFPMRQLLLASVLLLPLTTSLLAARKEAFVVKPPTGLETSGKVVAIVPDAYDGSKPYPVLLLLHGAGDNENAWPDKAGDLGALADKHGRILLCPSAGKFSWYNSHNGSEAYLMEKVLPAAADRYKLTTDRWIAGNSMGGYGALRLFANHPTGFTAAIAFSPGTRPSRWTSNWNIANAFGPSVKTGTEDTFTEDWLKKLPSDGRPIVMLCGDRDFFLKDFNESLATAEKAGRGIITYPTRGDHSWKYWSAELPGALEKLAPVPAGK